MAQTQLSALKPLLLACLWLLMSLQTHAAGYVTKTIILVSTTNGFASLTGSAESAVLKTMGGDPGPKDSNGVTTTVVLIQATNGYMTLTGSAASGALQTFASGGLAGTSGYGAAQSNGLPAGSAGATSDDDGGEGSDSGSWSLSSGAIAGIATGVGVLIVGVFVLWLLWFLKKKRGWEIRKSISRASRRLTGRDRRSRLRPGTMRHAIRMESPQRDPDLEKGPTIKITPANNSTPQSSPGTVILGPPPPRQKTKVPVARFAQ